MLALCFGADASVPVMAKCFMRQVSTPPSAPCIPRPHSQDSEQFDDDKGLYQRNQPWREGYASLQCLHAFAHFISPGSAVLHEGDCACVVAAINKGTCGSVILHRLALKIWKAAAQYSVLSFSGWVPGSVSSNKVSAGHFYSLNLVNFILL